MAIAAAADPNRSDRGCYFIGGHRVSYSTDWMSTGTGVMLTIGGLAAHRGVDLREYLVGSHRSPTVRNWLSLDPALKVPPTPEQAAADRGSSEPGGEPGSDNLPSCYWLLH